MPQLGTQAGWPVLLRENRVGAGFRSQVDTLVVFESMGNNAGTVWSMPRHCQPHPFAVHSLFSPKAKLISEPSSDAITQPGRLSFLVIDHTPAGGVERVTARQIGLFQDAGIPVFSLISVVQQHAEPFMEFPAGLKTDVMCPDGKKEELTARLSEYLRRWDVRFLIFQGDNMSIALSVLKAAHNAGCVALPIWHGSPYAYLRKYYSRQELRERPWLWLRMALARVVRPIKLRKARRVIEQAVNGLVCVSEGARHEVIALHGLAEEKAQRVLCIHNPLTVPVGAAAIRDAEKKNIVVYVARLERKHKNSPAVIEIWRRVAAEHPDWELRILGDGSARAEMERMVARYDVPRVVFRGVVADVDAELRQSSVAMLTSDCEGINMGLVEAAVCGNALISFAADGGVGDIVLDGETGFLVPSGALDIFAERLASLMDDRALRVRLGRGAAARTEVFSDHRIINQWRGLLQNQGFPI